MISSVGLSIRLMNVPKPILHLQKLTQKMGQKNIGLKLSLQGMMQD